jgi:hypothetical protein
MNKIVRLRTCNIIIGNVVRKNIDISLYDRYRAIVSNENQSSWRAVGIGNHRTTVDEYRITPSYLSPRQSLTPSAKIVPTAIYIVVVVVFVVGTYNIMMLD